MSDWTRDRIGLTRALARFWWELGSVLEHLAYRAMTRGLLLDLEAERAEDQLEQL